MMQELDAQDVPYMREWIEKGIPDQRAKVIFSAQTQLGRISDLSLESYTPRTVQSMHALAAGDARTARRTAMRCVEGIDLRQARISNQSRERIY